MTNLMKSLYIYAQSHTMAAFLAQDTEYERCIRCAQVQEAKLRTVLTPEESTKLKALLDERDLQLFIQNRAAFSAGFRIALELSR